MPQIGFPRLLRLPHNKKQYIYPKHTVLSCTCKHGVSGKLACIVFNYEAFKTLEILISSSSLVLRK